MTDPWNCGILIENKKSDLNNKNKLEFEDNFLYTKEEISNISLPDSKQYIESLEKKLHKIKQDPNTLKQLSEKREECLRNFLNENFHLDKESEIIYETSITNRGTAVQEIYRHLQPVQPMNYGEILNIIKYDQLEENRILSEECIDSKPASR